MPDQPLKIIMDEESDIQIVDVSEPEIESNEFEEIAPTELFVEIY